MRANVVKSRTVSKNKRIYTRTTCEERNKQSFEKYRQSQHHLDNEISSLLKIPEFDPVKSVVLDSMHGQILANLQRKVFDIVDLNNWKATQFCFFFLYGGILVLHHVPPTEKCEHFCLLYVSIIM